MGSKKTYKAAKKAAREKLREAWREYKRDIKKAKLIKQRTDVTVALETMGVVHRQIPVVIENSKPQKIKVQVA